MMDSQKNSTDRSSVDLLCQAVAKMGTLVQELDSPVQEQSETSASEFEILYESMQDGARVDLEILVRSMADVVYRLTRDR